MLTATTKVDFDANSYMDWTLQSTYMQTLSNRETDFTVSFRTRDHDGVIFHLPSPSTDFMRLQIVDNVLELSYDLGGGVQTLRMDGVQTSDGQWHTVHIQRGGKLVVLTMDNAEGPRYITSAGNMDVFEEMVLSDTVYAGGHLKYNNGIPELMGQDFNSCEYFGICLNEV